MDTALSLALHFLGDHDSAWLTAKQGDWLRRLVARENRERSWPRNRDAEIYAPNLSSDGAHLNVCAPNGCCLLLRVKRLSEQEIRRREFEAKVTPISREMNDAAARFDDDALKVHCERYRTLCREYADVTGKSGA